MPTLFLTPRQTVDSQALWKAAAAAGWTTERLSGWRVPEHLRAAPQPVLYGEALFGPALAEQLGLQLLNPAEDWLVRLPRSYSQRDISLCSLGEARQRTAPAFIKPPNDKSFEAAVYQGADLPQGLDEAMPVLVSEVVHWTCEFRCFVLNRELQTLSLYARDGAPQEHLDYACTPDELAAATAFVHSVLADARVDLPRATVIDVGQIAGRGWACVEQNAAWGAGLYGCQPAAVLRVVEHASVPMPTQPTQPSA